MRHFLSRRMGLKPGAFSSYGSQLNSTCTAPPRDRPAGRFRRAAFLRGGREASARVEAVARGGERRRLLAPQPRCSGTSWNLKQQTLRNRVFHFIRSGVETNQALSQATGQLASTCTSCTAPPRYRRAAPPPRMVALTPGGCQIWLRAPY